MHHKTKQLLERIKRGNGSAAVKITKAHFASLLDDCNAMGKEALLTAVVEHLSAKKRRKSGRPKTDFEVLVGDILATSDMVTKDVLRGMYDHIAPSLGQRMPGRSRVRSLPKFIEHMEPLIGQDGLKKAARAVQQRRSQAH
ncbi:MAG: hypothetical protein KTR31_03745 [Myxococcales bacterium]|nr:hypothetical protein [Myxococcales bacterium]